MPRNHRLWMECRSSDILVPDLTLDACEADGADGQLGGSLGPTGNEAADGWLPVRSNLWPALRCVCWQGCMS